MRRDGLETFESAKTVVNVNNIISDFQVTKVRDEGTEPRFADRGRRRGCRNFGRFTKDVAFSVDDQRLLGHFESARKMADYDRSGFGNDCVIAKDLVDPFSHTFCHHRINDPIAHLLRLYMSRKISEIAMKLAGCSGRDDDLPAIFDRWK